MFGCAASQPSMQKLVPKLEGHIISSKWYSNLQMVVRRRLEFVLVILVQTTSQRRERLRQNKCPACMWKVLEEGWFSNKRGSDRGELLFSEKFQGHKTARYPARYPVSIPLSHCKKNFCQDYASGTWFDTNTFWRFLGPVLGFGVAWKSLKDMEVCFLGTP